MKLGTARVWADSALVVVTLLWGSTFILVKDAVASIPVFPFLSIRFAIGTLVLSVVYKSSLFQIKKDTLMAGLQIGLALFLGYTFQTYGLVYTTASKAGFITGLNVILVPIGSAFILKTRPEAWSIAGGVLSAIGMGLLCLKGIEAPGLGDLLVLGCAFAFALQVLLVSRYSRGHDAAALCIVQMAVTCIASAGAGLATDGIRSFTVHGVEAWSSLIFLGVAATAGAFLLQTIAQRHSTATRAALILALEPVFSAVFAWFLAGEGLTAGQWAGGILILVGIVASEIGPETKCLLKRGA